MKIVSMGYAVVQKLVNVSMAMKEWAAIYQYRTHLA